MSLRPHTTRHLCLTDLARMGWELHTIATFAGHRHTDSTLQYIHLSGRDLADKLSRGMEHIHAWRIAMLTGIRGSHAPLVLTPCWSPLRHDG
nr:tyrosine-type recombinase/integrase [Nonomuraea basaltis]